MFRGAGEAFGGAALEGVAFGEIEFLVFFKEFLDGADLQAGDFAAAGHGGACGPLVEQLTSRLMHRANLREVEEVDGVLVKLLEV